ncbi:transmembrane pair domain protein [Gluconacetobacter diazotrophicus PA1 5]|uniref:PACE efflux transporter n=2 Tax=Gluconacetobacter diazotrophicus TaxID=33996 RepID=A0A7W4I5F4_GLUDI|nr:PACE efflux transporter [Gluconacetobacter diazotrophicus]ACI49876.1 transmembrane pair domain protein [Gluconacetobacter diazotrophicus PA1 5]MBB2155795.1 PACE efflux transporter [Gluconacetobacter diazotrophicus]CAP55792.1 putative membrane protein [Gluconacetobacter diazotrophicus PA1 5]
MRTTRDRIRYVLLFETLGLAMVVPGGQAVLGIRAADMGAIGLGSTSVAVLWNYIFNRGFDRALLALKGTTHKVLADRLAHAVLYQVGLIVMLVPAIALYLGQGLLSAFVANISLTLFYLVYNFAFTWAYDIVFPVPAAALPHGGRA